MSTSISTQRTGDNPNGLKDALRDNPSLIASTRDGMSHASMLGVGETYLGAFAVFLQGTPLQIGVLGTLPALIGALFQMAGAGLIERRFRRRQLIVFFSIVQALLWLLLGTVPYVEGIGAKTVSIFILLVILYHSVSGIITPVWNSLIGDLVPAMVRGKYFAYRGRLCSAVTLASVILAGFLLEVFQRAGKSFYGFILIFALACCARLFSAFWLSKHEDPPHVFTQADKFTFFQFLRRTPHSNFARFVLFVSLMNFATFLAAPFFSVYMLRDLALNYREYTFLLGVSVVSQIVALQYWGVIVDRFGSKKILEFCSIGVTLVPFPWLISSHLGWLVFAQAFAGAMWAGFHLATSNFLFDAVSPPKRARCVAYQATMNGIFLLAGSLLGGYLATHFDAPIPFSRWFWVPESRYLFVFTLSGVLRGVVAVSFVRMFREVREVESIRRRDLIFRIAHVRPLAGITFWPLTGSVRKGSAASSSDIPNSH